MLGVPTLFLSSFVLSLQGLCYFTILDNLSWLCLHPLSSANLEANLDPIGAPWKTMNIFEVFIVHGCTELGVSFNSRRQHFVAKFNKVCNIKSMCFLAFTNRSLCTCSRQENILWEESGQRGHFFLKDWNCFWTLLPGWFCAFKILNLLSPFLLFLWFFKK